jgi:hypothetical protein
MPRVPVGIIGETIRAGWGLKVGTRIKVGQPFRVLNRPNRRGRS